MDEPSEEKPEISSAVADLPESVALTQDAAAVGHDSTTVEMHKPTDAPAETSSSIDVLSDTVQTTNPIVEAQQTRDALADTLEMTSIPEEKQDPIDDASADIQNTSDTPTETQQTTSSLPETQEPMAAPAEIQQVLDTPAEALQTTKSLQEAKDETDETEETSTKLDIPAETHQTIDVAVMTAATAETSQITNPSPEVQSEVDVSAETEPKTDVLVRKDQTTDQTADQTTDMTTAAAETQQETKIPPEQVSSSSTLATEVKSDDHDIESSALDQQDEKAVWSSKLKGWRFWAINLALGLGIFLSQMETTIVSTSLVSITNDLNGFQSVSWIVTSYLVTYTGFLAIISKMSDIFGRKSLTAITFAMFILFSLGCGLAQTMNQLIILRAFQGIGGGGIYAMSYVIFPEISTPEMYGGYAAYLSLMAALACLLGPLLGGAINDNTTWRWVFWINVPIGLIALILILIAIPRNFPHPPHNSPLALPRQTLNQKLHRIDAIGTFLLLAASVLLVAALEEGGTAYSWTSAIPLSCLIISLFLWTAFIFYAKSIHKRRSRTTIEATFPWNLMRHRFTIGCLWNAFFVGGIFLVLAISIPQRLQVVHGDSPFTAGLRILPLTLLLPLGTILSGLFQSRLGVPPLYTFLIGGTIHTIGISLLGSVTVTSITPPFYIYQAISGFGLGISLATSIMTIPLVVANEHRAVAMGSIGQFRMLGGAVILAIFANVLNNPVSAQLAPYLTPDQLSALLQSSASISLLPSGLRAQVLGTYESAYQKQLRVLIAFSVGGILASLLLWERRPRRQRDQGILS